MTAQTRFTTDDPERRGQEDTEAARQGSEADAAAARRRLSPSPAAPLAGRRRRRRLDGLAEIDEVLRQLADLLCVPLGCRRRACRASERCAGGKGPPCVYEEWMVFVAHFETKTRDLRRFWARQRLLAREMQAGGKPRDRSEGAR